MAVTATRGRSQSKFNAYLEGGPELAAKLAALDKKVRNEFAKNALREGGLVIAEEWAAQVPVLDGHYRRSLQQDDTVKVAATKNGASGSVRPTIVAGIPLNEQPILYAAKLEFTSEPSARPAFDASRDHAAQVTGDILGGLIEHFA